jgi:hypothetical protein
MLLLLTVGSGTVFELVQSAFENRGVMPGSSERVGQLIDTAFCSIRSSGTASKHNVANGISAWIWAT